MFSTQHNPLQELCTSPTNMTAGQLQPCRDQCLVDTKILRQQWWRCLQIEHGSPQWFLDMRGKKKEIVRSKVGLYAGCAGISQSQSYCKKWMSWQWWAVTLSEGRWWHHFTTGVIFWMEDRPHIIMQHNSTICVTKWSVRWDCMVQHKFFRGKKPKYSTFRAPQVFSMQLSPCWHSRITFCNLTLQFWIMLVQPQSIHCQIARKECFSITENMH